MKKLITFLVFAIVFVSSSTAQNPFEFYLDPSLNIPKCKFTDDAIYFYGGSSIVKTDYLGDVLWSKNSNIFSRLIIEGSTIFGTDGVNIYKIDTSGNGIWIKNLSVPVNPSNVNPNSISDIIFDGNKLFVSVVQCPINPPYDPITQTQLALDTGGNILNVVCDTAFPQMQARIGSRSLKKGGWLALFDLSGMAHGSIVAKLDSNGNFLQTGNSVNFGGTVAEVQEIIPMADSTYFLVCNDNGPFASFTCARIRENGSIVWQSSYRVDGVNTHAYYFTSDSLNNVYILGYATLGWDFIPIVIKLDSVGNIVIAKSWSYSNNGTGKIDFGHGNNYFYNGMHYKNNAIYCIGNLIPSNKTTIIAFDTLFSGSCYSPDSNLSVTRYSAAWSGPPFASLSAYSYSSPNSTLALIPILNPLIHNLCVLLGTEEKLNESSFSILPNPFISTITFHFPNPQIEKVSLKIFNSMGQEVVEKELRMDDQDLNLTDLPMGVYFVSIRTENELFTSKIFKE